MAPTQHTPAAECSFAPAALGAHLSPRILAPLPAPSQSAVSAQRVGRTVGRDLAIRDESETSDLLAILLGGEPRSARARARALLDEFEISELARASPDHLLRAAGISRPAARRLAAAFAIGRRAARGACAARPAMRSPTQVHELMSAELFGLAQETFHVLLLDGKHRLRRRQRVSEGTLTTSLVHPREVFGPALREGAAALICVHNHPSGDPEPSREDLEVTRRLIEAGRLVGVPLLDHVVVAEEGYVSIRERINFDAL